MNEHPDQDGFPETTCPIGLIGQLENDSRSFYFASLFNKRYEGRFEPRRGKWTRAMGTLERQHESVLELSGRRYRRMSGPDVVWHQAEDDVNYSSLKMGYGPLLTPRHFHTDFIFQRRQLHLDYVKFINWGPLSGVEEFLVFSEGHFITRGGHYGIPPAGGRINWPLASPMGESLVTVEGFLKAEAMELKGPRVGFWTLSD